MKSRVLLFLLLAVSTHFYGQITFTENIVTGNPYDTASPELVRTMDIDGDGDLDIVTYGQELNWYKNVDGLGGFGEKNVIVPSTGANTGTGLFIVDFDNDGVSEIMGTIGSHLNLYKNSNGLGNFTVMQTYNLGCSALVAIPTDVDGDGNMDILCYYRLCTPDYQAKLMWLRNNGNGTFAAEQVITTSYSILEGTSVLATSDLDGDHDQDIIIGYGANYNKIAWFKNTDGLGNFSAPTTISTAANGITSIATADIDHDGDFDIVASLATNNNVVWYKNTDGLGTFTTENVITTNATASNAVIANTINNDSSIDIVYTGSNEIGWISNTNGLGNFGAQQVITTAVYNVKGVIMADLDGDGKKDLISVSQDDDKVAWYKNLDDNGNFGRQNVICRRVEFPNNVYAADFDGDNDVDILVNSQYDAKLTWLENVNGQGFYGKEHIIAEHSVIGNNNLPVAYPADIDGDGDTDIVAVRDNTLIWYENVDGHGNFTTQHVINPASVPSIIRAKDVDGDGKIDIVCGFYSSNKITWYKNLGAAGFGTEQIIAADVGGNNGSLTSLELADMDGDHDIDIIASSFNISTYYYKNTDGLGNFALQNNIIFSLYRMEAVYPADVDGDGDNDIIAVNSQGGGSFNQDGVVWFENTDGLGHFTIKHIISSLTTYGRSIHAADIDNDGDIDVLTSGGYGSTTDHNLSGQLAWYENNGHGVFTARQMIQEQLDNSKGYCVTVGDVNNDGNIDVLAVFGAQGMTILDKVAVYKNSGNLSTTIQEGNFNKLNIYPNPTTGILNINSSDMIKVVSIYDINGRTLKELHFDEPIIATQLDINDFITGVYFLKVESNKGSTNRKIIKK